MQRRRSQPERHRLRQRLPRHEKVVRAECQDERGSDARKPAEQRARRDAHAQNAQQRRRNCSEASRRSV